MDRSVWTEQVTTSRLPAWKCPGCLKGHVIMEEDSHRYEETAESKAMHGDDGWDPDWISYTFTAWGKCTHTPCSQTFAVAGVGGVDMVYDEDGAELVEVFHPQFCSPMPRIIEIPTKCPHPIKHELNAAFALFFADRGACAGRLRIVLELMMDHLGIAQEKSVNGRTSQLKLHARIEEFSKQNAEIGNQLMALKWLGNTAAHEGIAHRGHLLDAFEILEHVLAEVIDERSARVAALADKMKSRYGK
ncbi:DUF4145 domain-containing protein [Stutzerimonas zhaodongensis]|uniref:DUF4145 domain-containing protein n=1 Tax=Stutzerimonas zhaodongensis TaxID=1176257 RepID=A0A3M2HUM9_9GAMM|nr:DUF4145 domain-containing protein [Stutzerimonas zhaodongensis]MCQ4314466.1 DUF4145 domain-containing protein [Stutzerimonas zhaodongensis]RMH91985.1 DUF4145 domain-containing protein [Stutzerimonas zhaodongensis]